jgi:hypothetical protein
MRTLLLTLSIALVGCSAPQLEITPRFQQFNIDGSLAASSSGTTSRNDLAALGIDDNPIEFAPRADFSVAGFELTADYFDVSYAGSGDVEGDIEFGGEVFTVGTTVDTELDLKIGRVAATWDFIPTKMFDLGIGAGVGLADVRAFVQDQGTLNSSETDEKAPFPFLAGRARVALSSLSAEVLVGFLSFDSADVKAEYLDVDALVRWSVIGGTNHVGVSLIGGYRLTQLDLEYEDGSDKIDINADLSGPYLGLSLTL